MLNKPPLDELLPKTENRYTLAVLVAKRARQLVDGGQPMVDSESPNLVTLASEEVVSSTVVGVPGEHDPLVPIRPEIAAARLAAERDADNDMSFDLISQVQNIATQTEPEAPAPRPSMIKILGEDGKIYEQDEIAAMEAEQTAEADDESDEDADEDVNEEELADLDTEVDDNDLELTADVDTVKDEDEEEEA